VATDDSPFLSRWSRRKAQVREGLPVAPEAAVPVVLPPTEPEPAPDPLPEPPGGRATPMPVAEAAPALTLDDVALLTRDSNYAGFVARGVAPDVKNAALKKLFTDPHFNVMDGLDTYIDDYSKPDPLPEGMLRQMVQSKLLGLFDDDPPEPEARAADAGTLPAIAPSLPTLPLASEPTAPETADEDADLQLQPDDAAGRPGLEPGPGKDAGRQH